MSDKNTTSLANRKDPMMSDCTAMQNMFSRDPYINGGDLCITGTRIPVWVLWDARSGSNFQEYIDNLQMDYPSLSTDQIKSALQYAFGHPVEIDKDRLRHEVMSDHFGDGF